MDRLLSLLDRCLASHACYYVTRIGGYFIQWLGPCLILMATALFTVITYTFFAVLMPYITENFSAVWWVGSVFGLWILFNIVFNYFSCILTPPGQPPADDAETANLLRGKGPVTESDAKNGGEFSNYCKRCDKPKPPRTHHCHVCGKCVLMMDHHCPWVANCVGYGNYRYFYLFLFYLFVGCLYAAVLSFFPFLATVVQEQPESFSNETAVVLTFMITVSVGAAIAFMLGWHTYLICTAQTTIEFYRNQTRAKKVSFRGKVSVNEYDLGRTRNWAVVFGKSRYWFSWMLPSWRKPPTDGMHFPTTSNPDL